MSKGIQKKDARPFDGTSPSLFPISHQSTRSRKPASSPSQPLACDIPKNTSLPAFLPNKRKYRLSRYMYLHLQHHRKEEIVQQSINQSIRKEKETKASSQIPIRHRRPRQPLPRCLATAEESSKTHSPTSLLVVRSRRSSGTAFRQ